MRRDRAHGFRERNILFGDRIQFAADPVHLIDADNGDNNKRDA